MSNSCRKFSFYVVISSIFGIKLLNMYRNINNRSYNLHITLRIRKGNFVNFIRDFILYHFNYLLIINKILA
ncbi:hypothetical protein C2G38_2067601 [Gigaspora rosea]|uniref:Uncharacterized protein n=1 Tax=Gigaspora rosea TaxID=44941 RepID=A0A397VUD9_9GLOM|nr:hypothetical protein C2G38_2067601 [Gigaspora rosea]